MTRITLVSAVLLMSTFVYGQREKTESINTKELKYPLVYVENLSAADLVVQIAKNGKRSTGTPELLQTESMCVPQGGNLKDVVKVPTYYYAIPTVDPKVVAQVSDKSGSAIYAAMISEGGANTEKYGFDECANWFKPNFEKKWSEESAAYLKKLADYDLNAFKTKAKDAITESLFFEIVEYETEVATFKKKGIDYSDLDKAQALAISGYAAFVKDIDSKEGSARLQEAIDLWENAINEGDANDKNARINKKVLIRLYEEEARAYKRLGKYDEALQAINSAINLGPKNVTNNTTIGRDAMQQSIVGERSIAQKYANEAPVFAPDQIEVRIEGDSRFNEFANTIRTFQSEQSLAYMNEVQNAKQEEIANGTRNPYEDKVMQSAAQGNMLILNPNSMMTMSMSESGALVKGNEPLEEFPLEITELTDLNQLILKNNKLTSIPPEISRLVNLKKLDLSNNQLTSLPEEIGELRNLKNLIIKGNDISSDQVEQLQKLLPGCKIKA